MITFEFQEDFEEAVMNVIANRLGVVVETGGMPVNGIVQVTLIDNQDDSVIDADRA